jgi:hypothetical protein
MPLPPSNFIACFPLQAYFVDKDTGFPLSAGVIKFFEDEARTIPKDVYIQQQQPDNSYLFVNIGSQVTLSSVGTTQYLGTDAIIFLFPFVSQTDPTIQLYYIEVYSSLGVLQFTREAWPPNAQLDGTSNTTQVNSSVNMISNPQFSRVLFQSPNISVTINVTGISTTEIAPDWSIITNGNGTLTVEQIANTDTGAPGAPAFELQIDSTGLTNSYILSQRISQSPRIFEGSYVAGTFSVHDFSGNSNTFTMNYVPSLGATTTIVSGLSAVGSTVAISGVSATVIPATNTQGGDIGYVDIQIVIPPSVQVRISCVQVLANIDQIPISYVQESTPSQVNRLFHYYQTPLNYKPISSYLVGWDFPLNPAQLGANGTLANGANKSGYIWDQTILFQTVNNITYARDAATNALNITPTADSSFALIQYLPANVAREILSQNISLQLNAIVSTSTISGTISVWWTTDATLPDIKTPNFNSLVSVITAGVPTAGNGSWTQVPNLYTNAPSIPFTLNTTYTPQSFIGFSAGNTAATTATFMAIVICFDTMPSTTTMKMNYCSLNGGDIPTRPAAQSSDEVLRQCQYYYEKSYIPSVLPGAITEQGQLEFVQTFLGNDAYASSFVIQYKTTKRVATATPAVYSPSTGTLGNVDAYAYNGGPSPATAAGITTWTVDSISFDSAAYSQAGGGSGVIIHFIGLKSASIDFQYVVDARLGVI